MPRSLTSPRNATQKGYILISTALLLVALIGATGLSVDLGRMYIARHEAQTFADAAAISAALELNGTAFGVTNATNAALAVSKKYDLQTKSFTGTDVYFSTTDAGPWETNPANPANIRYARVIARTSIPVFFVPVTGASSTGGGAAAATAGQTAQDSFGNGLFPMTPFGADEGAAENGGLIPGEIYTLRWGGDDGKLNQIYDPPNGGNGGACPGDFNMASKRTTQLATGEPSSRRGYYAPHHSSSEQSEAIVNGLTGEVTIEVGDVIDAGPGGHNSNGNAIQARIAQDTDTVSTTFAQYEANRIGTVRVGNGRRIIGAPVNSGKLGSTPYEVVAIGAFFLLEASWYDANGNQPLCAEFIGPWVQGSKNPGAGTGGSYVVRLTE